MKKRELAQAVATQADVDPRVAARVIDGTLDVILATVAKGEDVALTGFAKFSKVKRPARTARNPATGEPVKVKAKTVAKITALKGFKDVVLGASPAPKLTKAAPAASSSSKAGAATGRTGAPAPAKASAGTAKAGTAKATASKAGAGARGKATAAPAKASTAKATAAARGSATSAPVTRRRG